MTGCKDKCPPEDVEIDTGKCTGNAYGDRLYTEENISTTPLLYITKLSSSIEVQIRSADFKYDSNHRGVMKYHFDNEAPAEINYRIKYFKMMNIGYLDGTIVLLGDASFIEKLKTAKQLTVELNGKTAGVQETTFDLSKIHDSCPFNPNAKQDTKQEIPGVGTVDAEIKEDGSYRIDIN